MEYRAPPNAARSKGDRRSADIGDRLIDAYDAISDCPASRRTHLAYALWKNSSNFACVRNTPNSSSHRTKATLLTREHTRRIVIRGADPRLPQIIALVKRMRR